MWESHPGSVIKSTLIRDRSSSKTASWSLTKGGRLPAIISAEYWATRSLLRVGIHWARKMMGCPFFETHYSDSSYQLTLYGTEIIIKKG